MTTAEHPITRTELREEFDSFREEMHRTLQFYATKEDLAEIRGELKSLRWTMGLVGIALSVLILVVRLLG